MCVLGGRVKVRAVAAAATAACWADLRLLLVCVCVCDAFGWIGLCEGERRRENARVT